MISEFPKRIVIELTPLCNLTCSMCPRHFIDEKDGFMARGLWEKLVDEIAERSPDSIILPFWRGESMLHPEFGNLLEYAFDRSLNVHISTNGHFSIQRHREVLMRCEFVTFSIHSEKGYAYAREFLASRIDSAPTVQVSFVKGEKSTDELLPEILATSDLAGFDSIRLYDEHTKDGVFGKAGYVFDVPRTFCPKLTDTLVIAYDGTISRCNHIWETEKGFDLSTNSIREAWGGSTRLQQIRQNYPDALCGPCDQWTGHTCGESWRKNGEKIEHMIFGPTGIVHG